MTRIGDELVLNLVPTHRVESTLKRCLLSSTENSAIVVARADTIDAILSKAAAEGRKVLLDFHATWCGPCKNMHPVVERFASENPDVTVVTVDIDDCMQFSLKNGVRSVPTFMVKQGDLTLRTSRGAQPYDSLKKLVTG